jgi:hypothetical protein
LAAGTGILLSDVGGTKTIALDTATAVTKAITQTGETVFCNDAGSTDSYACSLNPALSQYTAGMMI